MCINSRLPGPFGLTRSCRTRGVALMLNLVNLIATVTLRTSHCFMRL